MRRTRHRAYPQDKAKPGLARMSHPRTWAPLALRLCWLVVLVSGQVPSRAPALGSLVGWAGSSWLRFGLARFGLAWFWLSVSVCFDWLPSC